ncbi:hypothetical protein Y1Q_0020847 [Alligator mississippiensis]|uniref:Uncharacterized protein n=1 Tax=Alligator mississippiensis TaxID=8496 RepID=A0A151NJ36_ALLMI|nr:hypothetical protein Y1Q_0020847 [Alligator mississippiensis]
MVHFGCKMNVKRSLPDQNSTMLRALQRTWKDDKILLEGPSHVRTEMSTLVEKVAWRSLFITKRHFTLHA